MKLFLLFFFFLRALAECQNQTLLNKFLTVWGKIGNNMEYCFNPTPEIINWDKGEGKGKKKKKQ